MREGISRPVSAVLPVSPILMENRAAPEGKDPGEIAIQYLENRLSPAVKNERIGRNSKRSHPELLRA